MIYETIKTAIDNGVLSQPFNVVEVNKCCNNLLSKSPSFLSKHRKGGPGGYKVYFVQKSKGEYSIV
ncbi:MAG: hypothetical protein NTZ59_15230 [Bacteroidetes bacterium]|nr:hypothetical protein [Bacteroidota bacterium]